MCGQKETYETTGQWSRTKGLVLVTGAWRRSSRSSSGTGEAHRSPDVGSPTGTLPSSPTLRRVCWLQTNGHQGRGGTGPKTQRFSVRAWARAACGVAPSSRWMLCWLAGVRSRWSRRLAPRSSRNSSGQPTRLAVDRSTPHSQLFREEQKKAETHVSALIKNWRLPTLAEAIQPLPSAMQRFTTVFGMGTGGTTALLPPENRLSLKHRQPAIHHCLARDHPQRKSKNLRSLKTTHRMWTISSRVKIANAHREKAIKPHDRLVPVS